MFIVVKLSVCLKNSSVSLWLCDIITQGSCIQRALYSVWRSILYSGQMWASMVAITVHKQITYKLPSMPCSGTYSLFTLSGGGGQGADLPCEIPSRIAGSSGLKYNIRFRRSPNPHTFKQHSRQNRVLFKTSWGVIIEGVWTGYTSATWTRADSYIWLAYIEL